MAKKNKDIVKKAEHVAKSDQSNEVVANCDHLKFEVQNLHLKHDNLEELIYTFRGCYIMIDSDLADIYEVETKYLKRAVKANIDRFPEDFMFVLSSEEIEILRCKNGTSNYHSLHSVFLLVFIDLRTIGERHAETEVLALKTVLDMIAPDQRNEAG